MDRRAPCRVDQSSLGTALPALLARTVLTGSRGGRAACGPRVRRFRGLKILNEPVPSLGSGLCSCGLTCTLMCTQHTLMLTSTRVWSRPEHCPDSSTLRSHHLPSTRTKSHRLPPHQAAHGPGCPWARLPMGQVRSNATTPAPGHSWCLQPPGRQAASANSFRLPFPRKQASWEDKGFKAGGHGAHPGSPGGKGLREHPSAASNLKMKERKEH